MAIWDRVVMPKSLEEYELQEFPRGSFSKVSTKEQVMESDELLTDVGELEKVASRSSSPLAAAAEHRARDVWFLVLLKYAFALSGIFAGWYNTVNQAYVYGAVISTYSYQLKHPQVNEYYSGSLSCNRCHKEGYDSEGHFVCIQQERVTGWTECRYGFDKVSVNCSFSGDPVFLIFLRVWMTYWSLLLIMRLALTGVYNTGDLRFHIACERANHSRVNVWVVRAGMALSVVSCVVGVVEAVLNSAPSQASLSTVLFAAVNLVALRGFLATRYERVPPQSSFPEPVWIILPERSRSLWNVWGAFRFHDDVFRTAELAVVKDDGERRYEYVQLLGDGPRIRGAVEMLMDGKDAVDDRR